MRPISKIELFILRYIFKNVIIQSTHHTLNIVKIFTTLREVCEKQFTEDNFPTMTCFLEDCLKESSEHMYKKNQLRFVALSKLSKEEQESLGLI